jgi:hypothetical protein
MHPHEEAFYLPSSAGAPVRRDQLDVVFLAELLVVRLGIVDFVADEAGRPAGGRWPVSGQTSNFLEPAS